MWEKEKMLVSSIFSFPHNVLKKLLSQTCQKVSLCGNGLIKCKTPNFVRAWFTQILTSKNALKFLYFDICGRLNCLNLHDVPLLTLPQIKPWFLRVCSTSHLKTLWEKEKSLITSNFSFTHSVFYPFGELSTIFIKPKIVACKLFELGSLKFAV